MVGRRAVHVKTVLQEVRRRVHLESALGPVGGALLLVLLAADGDLLDALGDRVYCLLRRFHGLGHWSVLRWCFAVLRGRQRGGLVKRSGFEGWSTAVIPRQNTWTAKIRPGISRERLTHGRRLATKALITVTSRSFGYRWSIYQESDVFSTYSPSTWLKGR